MDFVKDFPNIRFIPGRFFMWAPHNRSITYDQRRVKTANGRAALLHEIGHAVLDHKIYKFDMELIKIEMDAWDFVRQNADRYALTIDEDYIAECMESYDQWLSKRATCPDCNNFCLQKDRNQYSCFACGSKWTVNWRKDRRVKRTVTSRLDHAPGFRQRVGRTQATITKVKFIRP